MTQEEKEVLQAAMQVYEAMKAARFDSTDRVAKNLFAACAELRYREEMKFPKIAATLEQRYVLGQEPPPLPKIVKAERIFQDGKVEELTAQELETLQKGWNQVP